MQYRNKTKYNNKNNKTMKTNNPTTAEAFVNYRNAEGSNLRSYGSDIWSYRTMIAQNVNGAILLTFRDYSNTTQRHKLHIRRAAQEAQRVLFEVVNINPTKPEEHKDNYNYLLEIARGYKAKADRARTEANRQRYGKLFAEARQTAREYYIKFIQA